MNVKPFDICQIIRILHSSMSPNPRLDLCVQLDLFSLNYNWMSQNVNGDDQQS